MRRFGWLVVASWPLAAMGQAPAPETLAGIKAEADSADGSFRDEIRKAKSEAVMRAAIEARHTRSLGLMDRALTLARLHPGQAEGIAASAWVATEAAGQRGDDFAKRGDAAYRLLADAPVLDDTAILPAMFAATGVGPRCPEAEPFLRSVISRSQNPDLVTLGRFGLGASLAEMARLHDRLAAPISGPALRKELTEASLDRCRAVDAPKLRSEAEALLEEVVREQGDEPNTLGGQAAGDLYRVRHLRIGQPAPELVGEDLDGAPIRLGDFRGKVVVLAFWSLSSDPNMRSIRRDKDLVAALNGRPFALVGVNGDAEEDRAKVQEAVAKEGIAWRSFRASGPDGEIPRTWGVQNWPTAYLLDAAGIIRDDHVGEELTPAALEPLVQAAERASR